MTKYKNLVIDRVCGFLKRYRTNELQIRIRTEFGTPEENTQELLRLVAEDFELVTRRVDADHRFMGRFLGIMLLIEKKISSLLEMVDPDLENKTLGRKIDTYRDFVSELERLGELDEEEVAHYRSLIGPLRELADIRGRMAHDLGYSEFGLAQIRQTTGIGRSLRPDLARAVELANDDDKPLVAIANFGFIISTETAELRRMVSHSLT